ncbi:trans-sialidase, putative [Trypanosoma cruzi marinkellei]|uniref:Trans-sialidase, putative n=1 Tax=Trypanosoma cruzi marinkellei TaxID=85056 RepID=K2NJS2_TRYCR|nr:trans-sialidase, putative [Trypanosoma cruzi marinkellei]
MLSRVAAVRAPCTHNRRRVTGSSGRRREGGESERQRPNMSRHVFPYAALLLLVLMMCCGTGGAAAAVEGNVRDTGEALKGIKWEKLVNWVGVSDAGGKYGSLLGLSLVEVQGHVFAIAVAHCKDGGHCVDVSSTGIVSRYLDLSAVAGPTDISTSDASIFGKDLLKESSEDVSTRNDIMRPTTLVIGDSVYMLLGNDSRTKPRIRGNHERGLLLVNGALSEDDGRKKIGWNETHAVSVRAPGDSYLLTGLVGGGGLGAVHMTARLFFHAGPSQGWTACFTVHLFALFCLGMLC